MTNKHNLVKEHLLMYGHITSWEAIQMYGATRLSAIIFNLRKKGYNIQSFRLEGLDRNGEDCHFVRYVLKEKE